MALRDVRFSAQVGLEENLCKKCLAPGSPKVHYKRTAMFSAICVKFKKCEIKCVTAVQMKPG